MIRHGRAACKAQKSIPSNFNLTKKYLCQDLPTGGFWTPLNHQEAVHRHFLVLVPLFTPAWRSASDCMTDNPVSKLRGRWPQTLSKTKIIMPESFILFNISPVAACGLATADLVLSCLAPGELVFEMRTETWGTWGPVPSVTAPTRVY